MPIDIDMVLQKIQDLQGKVNDLFALAGSAKEAKFSNKELGDVPFTVEQKQILITRYQTLKTEIITLVNQLP